jgi:spore germination protein KC
MQTRRRLERGLSFLLTIGLALASAGCWDLEEVGYLALVLALGLDAAPNGQLDITFQIAVPRNLVAAPGGGGGMGGGGGGGGGSDSGGGPPGFETLTVRSRNVSEAVDRLTANFARRPTLIHLEALVVGEELARRGLAGPIGGLEDIADFRGNVVMVVARGRASSLLTIQPLVEPRPSRYLDRLIHINHAAGKTPLIRVSDFLIAIEDPALDPVAPILERVEAGTGGGDRPRILLGAPSKALLTGLAVFRGDALVGEFDAQQSRLAQMLRGEWCPSTLTIADPKARDLPLSVYIREVQTSVRVRREGEYVGLSVRLDLQCELREVSRPGMPPATQEELDAIARALEGWLEPRLEEAIRLSQEDFLADSFGFGRRMRKGFRTLGEWLAFDWPDRYPEARIAIDVRAHIGQPGPAHPAPIPR